MIKIFPSKDFEGTKKAYPIANDITFKLNYLVIVSV